MSRYDLIVIGGGHNGLTAASMMARKGKRVLLLEKNPKLGGLAGTILQDCSQVRSEIVDALVLQRFGLKFKEERPELTLAGEGSRVVLRGDSVEGVSQKDAEAYREYRAFLGRVSGFLNELLNEAAPDIESMDDDSLGYGPLWDVLKKAASLRRLGKRDMFELLRVSPMCVADFLNERFESNLLKGALASFAIDGSFTGPWSPGTCLNLLLWESASSLTVEGGASALVEALEESAREQGVEIRTSAEVLGIRVEKGRVLGVKLKDGEEIDTDQVASSLDPRTTFLKLVSPLYLSSQLETRLVNYRARGTTAHLRVELKSEVSDLPVWIRTGDSPDEVEKAFDAIKYGEFSKKPVLEISKIEGGRSLSVMSHFAPYDLRAGWSDQTRSALKESILSEVFRVLPEVRDQVESSELMTPVDIEAEFGTAFGHIHHGEHALDQILLRPIPELSRYKSPIEGLSLCGSGVHPGGGITCAPGALASRFL